MPRGVAAHPADRPCLGQRALQAQMDLAIPSLTGSIQERSTNGPASSLARLSTVRTRVGPRSVELGAKLESHACHSRLALLARGG